MHGAARNLLLAALGLALAGSGYWLGSQYGASTVASDAAGADKAEPKILYYRNPMGLPDTSPVPKKDPMGMDYVPVYEGEQTDSGQGKIVYYRNPMGLADTSPVPKKDSMGMDYIPVYENEVTGPNLVRITADKVQKLGVKTAQVQTRDFSRSLRAVASLEVDERTLVKVAPRFEGWIERLRVNQTGQPVTKGQPLFDLYSPELYAAEQEYRIAAEGVRKLGQGDPESRRGLARLAENSLRRLQLWDVPAGEIARLRQGGEPGRTLRYPAPRSGIVLEKMAIEGARFMPGEVLFQLADLSTLWLQVEIPETGLAAARVGSTVSVTLDSYPGQSFSGKVDFVYPTLNTETRTARVRLVVPNADGRLKPGLYAQVELRTPAAQGLAVPESAVIDSGKRKVVLVALGGGLYQPREVATGARDTGFWQIISGLEPGEQVVTTANFLIDAESNLKAALEGMNTEAASPEAIGGMPSTEHDMNGTMAPADTTGHEGH